MNEDQFQWCLAIMIIDRYLNKHLRKGAFYHFRLLIDEGIVRADGLQLEIWEIAPQNSVGWEIQKYLHRRGFVFTDGRLIFVRASIWGYITYFQYINQVSNPPRKVSTIVSGSRQRTSFILSQRLSSWPYSIWVL